MVRGMLGACIEQFHLIRGMLGTSIGQVDLVRGMYERVEERLNWYVEY